MIQLCQFTNRTTKKPVLINPTAVNAVYAEAGDDRGQYVRLIIGDRIIDVTESFDTVSVALVGDVPF